MTQERTPLAVMATALHSDQVVRAATVVTGGSQTPTSEWWSAKKRKRTVACGQCDACCRDDCGACLNCLDKPKFGGNGIRKQSCLERKCRQPTAAPTPSSVVSSSKLAIAPAPVTNEARNSMPAHEWDDFWSAVECCMLLQGANALPMPNDSHGSSKRGRTNRCGTCAGCVRGDCGSCKNCKDKPKFGGKGIKKQACVRRVCNNPQPEGVSEDENDEVDHPQPSATKTSSAIGFLSAEPSPPLVPTAGFSGPPPLDLNDSESATANCSMLHDTRRRLQQLRANGRNEAAESSALLKRKRNADERPSSSMSMGYSTADEYEAGVAEPDNDDQHSNTEEDYAEDATHGGEPAAPALVALAMAMAAAPAGQ